MKGMIFAAGVGSRLKPFTDRHPKALVEVGGKPMLQRVIERMADNGIKDIVINVHHFADQIVDFLNANNRFGLNISVSDESDTLLDTGGGLAKAAPLLTAPSPLSERADVDDNRPDVDGERAEVDGEGAAYEEPILVHNADILTDFSIGELIDAFSSSKCDAMLLTAHRNSSRKLLFDTEGRLRGWENLNTGETLPPGLDTEGLEGLSFGGVHVISPRLLPLLVAEAKRTPVFSITPFYVNHAAELDIRRHMPSEPYRWFDIGKPETLAAARQSFG